MYTQTWVWQALAGREPREAPMEWEENIGYDLVAGQERRGHREKNYADVSQWSEDKEDS